MAALMLAGPAAGQPGPMDMSNRGTAPDWLNVCMLTAIRRLHVPYQDVRLDTQRATRWQRVAEGHAGGRRFRCVVDANDRLRSFALLGRARR